MQKVSGFTSMKTGFKPNNAMTSVVAMYVKEGVITSSPAFKPKAISAICKASVPFAHGMTCFTSRYCSNSALKPVTSGPLMN